MKVRFTVLGSGTSSGVPIVGCPCKVCASTHPKNKRLRSSCLVGVGERNFLIDTSPDLREQALRYKILRVDAVLYTHSHADHVHGIDEMRVYNALTQKAIPVYGDEPTIRHLTQNFKYIFNPSSVYPSLTPRLVPHVISGSFDFEGVSIQSIPCHHGTHMITNYRIGNGAWLTDTSGLPDESYELLQGLDVLFLDGLRLKPHPTHFHLEESLKAAQRIRAKKTYLIHLTDDYDHDAFNKTLPQGVELAYDGLVCEV